MADRDYLGEEEEVISGRYAGHARRVLACAPEEARALKHDHVGTEHLLLALASEGGIVRGVLDGMGATHEDMSRRILQMVPAGKEEPPGQLPWSPRAEKVTRLALTEALQLGHGCIGTEHLLLAIIREGDGIACAVLGKYLPLKGIRAKVIIAIRTPQMAQTEFPIRAPEHFLRLERKIDALLRHLGMDPEEWE